MKSAPVPLPNSKISLSSGRKRLDEIASRGIAWIYGKGYFWIRDMFMPLVTLVAKHHSAIDGRRLALAWYQIGDVFDFNKVPYAAIRAYRRSNAYFPNAAAFREIGTCEYQLGLRRRSIRSLQFAVYMDPSDSIAAQELALVTDKVTVPTFHKDDVVWQAMEAIARERPRVAIRMLDGMNSMRSLQALACAYAVDLDTLSCLATWEAIRRRAIKETLEPECSLWFFLPPALDASPEFWAIVMGMRSKIRRGYVPAERFWEDSVSAKIEQRARRKYFEWKYDLSLDKSGDNVRFKK